MYKYNNCIYAQYCMYVCMYVDDYIALYYTI